MRLAFAAALLASVPALAMEPWQSTALDDIRSEPKVVEAMFPNEQSSTLWVSVRDDGTSRDGFAKYLCLSLAMAGMPEGHSVAVHVYDAARMKDEMRELGGHTCRR